MKILSTIVGRSFYFSRDISGWYEEPILRELENVCRINLRLRTSYEYITKCILELIYLSAEKNHKNQIVIFFKTIKPRIMVYSKNYGEISFVTFC